MTRGQQESLFLIYVNVCNGLMYSDDLCNDDTLSTIAKSSVRLLRDKFKWMKTAMELKTDSNLLKNVDTLRFDEVLRIMAELEEDELNGLEKVIQQYLNTLK